MSYEAIGKHEVRFQAFLIRRSLTLRQKSRLSSSHVARTLGEIKICRHCRAELYSEEGCFCCHGGKIAVESLPQLPSGWTEMFMDSAFRKNSRKYNNLFCFSAIGVEGKEGFVHEGAASCVKIHA